ncbi:major facilitator superfamily domain-containing protein [Mycena latifolia]|nr:major facilitator superfamily domain-containing protein [Mycena latifolia]
MSPKPDQEWREEFTGAMDKYQPGSEAERRLVRKIDMRIVPTVWLLYVMSYLDRANIGNAESGGMQKELGYGSTQYSIILLMFFVSYVIFEVPSNMILTRVRPSLYLSGVCVLWGGVAACLAACKSWQQLAGVRFSLGIIEAGFAPGVAYYLSSWYKRHELAKRYSIYYTATAISGAFSGLLAGVIIEHLDGARGLSGWKWLLLIEGVGASFVGCFTWLILPDWPSTTPWLTEEEKFIAVQRLAYDGIGTNGGTGAAEPSHGEAFKLVLNDWRTWMLVVMYMLATGSQTIQYFIPTLVGQLGYTGNEKQFMTIPIYAVALLGILGFCFVSDIRKERGNYITAASCLSGISFIIVVAVDDKKVKYAFLCFAVAGIYAACPLTLLWVSSIIDHPAEKRAVAIALVNALGNSASIYGSFLWPSTTGPRFVQGFAVTTVFVFLLALLAQVNKVLLKKYPSVGLNDHNMPAEKAYHEEQKQSETNSNV